MRLDRVLFPETGITRRDLLAYYARVAPLLLPHLADRAVTVRRWPHGIHEPGFFQKHPVPGSDEPIRIRDPDDLLRWVALGAIEFHVPLAPLGDPEDHDWAVLDLDPQPPLEREATWRAARAAAAVCARLGIPFRAKTSGQRGVHLYIPIVPTPARAVLVAVERLARLVRAVLPDLVTLEWRRARRGPRVYLDVGQNAKHRTMAAVYTVRARPGAPVSWPLAPDDLARAPGPVPTLAAVRHGPLPPWDRPPPVDLGRILDAHGVPPLEVLRGLSGAPVPAPLGPAPD
ncbi:MAG: DNA primase [Actinomycetia bacterium]|nr:DNA primase [Actinomycetes bacterium]